MCKIHDAIHEIAKIAESDKITIWVDGVEIQGTLICCDEAENSKCFEDVLTLKDACAHCKECDEKKCYKWLNVSTWSIKAFTFECACE